MDRNWKSGRAVKDILYLHEQFNDIHIPFKMNHLFIMTLTAAAVGDGNKQQSYFNVFNRWTRALDRVIFKLLIQKCIIE